jgi:hypothetical protein
MQKEAKRLAVIIILLVLAFTFMCSFTGNANVTATLVDNYLEKTHHLGLFYEYDTYQNVQVLRIGNCEAKTSGYQNYEIGETFTVFVWQEDLKNCGIDIDNELWKYRFSIWIKMAGGCLLIFGIFGAITALIWKL